MSQVKNGKAFEHAVAAALASSLKLDIFQDSSARFAKECFETRSPSLRARFLTAAKIAVDHIFILERGAITQGGHVLIAGDALGQAGDVRDVLISQTNLGISCKANHEAFKHPRLSFTSDFVSRWGLNQDGCSNEYWGAVRPIFEELKRIKNSSSGQVLWKDLINVTDTYYKTVLDAFEKELTRVSSSDPEGVAVALLKYIIGRKDFYKVIAKRDHVEIQAFNLDGKLSSKRTKLPKKILGIDELDGGPNSRTVRFDGGWTFNFRIHSASSRVEPSLKFDIQAVALPPSLYKHHIAFD